MKSKHIQSIASTTVSSLIDLDIPRKINSLNHVHSANIIVEAICLTDGVNVTFQLLNDEVKFYEFFFMFF